eukprot:15437869-Alexandrium_andersonii.AAC.1
MGGDPVRPSWRCALGSRRRGCASLLRLSSPGIHFVDVVRATSHSSCLVRGARLQHSSSCRGCGGSRKRRLRCSSS